MVLPFVAFALNLLQELYPEDYYSIHWPSQRNNVAKVDLYAPHSKIYDFLASILSLYESCPFPYLRTAGVQKAYQMLCWEDENTAYQCLAPVNMMFNLVARYAHEGIDTHAWKMHEMKRRDSMWMSDQGMMVTGTNGSQLWDTQFIVQALVDTGLANAEGGKYKESMVKALEWLDQGQMRENPKHFETMHRQRTKGAWGFRSVHTSCSSYPRSQCRAVPPSKVTPSATVPLKA